MTGPELHETTSEFPVFLHANRTTASIAVERLSTKSGKTDGNPHFFRLRLHFSRGIFNENARPVENPAPPACPIPTPTRAKTTSTRAKTTPARARQPKTPLPFFPLFKTFIPEISRYNLIFPSFLRFFSYLPISPENPLIDILRYLTAPRSSISRGASML